MSRYRLTLGFLHRRPEDGPTRRERAIYPPEGQFAEGAGGVRGAPSWLSPTRRCGSPRPFPWSSPPIAGGERWWWTGKLTRWRWDPCALQPGLKRASLTELSSWWQPYEKHHPQRRIKWVNR